MADSIAVHDYFTISGLKSLLLTPVGRKKRKGDIAVTDQELRKLSRRDLLELLISQGRELEALRAELDQAMAALENRKIHLDQAGSIAEAALRLNGVFEAAQAAADQYLENIRRLNGKAGSANEDNSREKTEI